MNEPENFLPTLPTGEEIERRDAALQFLKDDKWQNFDVDKWRLDFTKAYHSPKYTLSWGGIPFAPLGGIHNITGQAGNGKTALLSQLVSAILLGEFGELKYELTETIPHPTVLFIDTEQEEDKTIEIKNRIMTCCERDTNQNYDDLIILALREMGESVEKDANGTEIRISDAENRWRAILKAIYQYKPNVVFIDGLLDVVSDFNDNKECRLLINKCMQLASHYQVSCWCIVHQNPGSDKLVGHLGSFIMRKVTDAFRVSKLKDPITGKATFTVSQIKNRGRDIPDWKFQILPVTSWGIPEQLASPVSVSTITTPIEVIKKWIQERKDKIQWPATRRDIYANIFEYYGKKELEEYKVYMQMSLNARLLREQSKSEMADGQRVPRIILNEDMFEEMPF